MRKLLITLVLFAGVTLAAQPRPGLSIRVIDGEGAVNIIQQKTALRAVVEVRDQNNLPVPGATVTFAIAGQGGASVAGAQTVTVVTNATGQAALTGATPLTTGSLQISVNATFNGLSATASISQTAVTTAATAGAAGGSAAGAAGSTAGTTGSAAGAAGSTAGATGGAAGAAGGAAGAAGGAAGAAGGAAGAAGAAGGAAGAAAGAAGAAGAAAGGVSIATVAGIVGGAAAVGGGVAAAGGGDSSSDGSGSAGGGSGSSTAPPSTTAPTIGTPTTPTPPPVGQLPSCEWKVTPDDILVGNEGGTFVIDIVMLYENMPCYDATWAVNTYEWASWISGNPARGSRSGQTVITVAPYTPTPSAPNRIARINIAYEWIVISQPCRCVISGLLPFAGFDQRRGQQRD